MGILGNCDIDLSLSNYESEISEIQKSPKLSRKISPQTVFYYKDQKGILWANTINFSHLHPSLIFVGKAGAYPSEALTEVYSKGCPRHFKILDFGGSDLQ
jgi:hypothetical protein